MKMKPNLNFILALSCAICMYATGAFATEPAKVTHRIESWLFDAPAAAQGKTGGGVLQGEFARPNPQDGFTLKFNVNLKPFEGRQQLIKISDEVYVTLRRAGADERDRQNYPAFKMADGSVPVLEAGIKLHRQGPGSKGEVMEIGFPLGMLEKSYGKHQIVLNFSGVRWTMYADGQLVDNDFPIGYPEWSGPVKWEINPMFVESAEIFTPAIEPRRDESKKPAVSPVQYWTPSGHNSWVGDVATTYHNGRYHVFYLYDRRHHASKFGTGGHYFEHLSTSDFKTWTEHEAATPIDEQWETFGTGAPFAIGDKLYVSYGLHTSRIYPDEKNMTPMLRAYCDNYGKTGVFDYDSFPTVPSGTTYSESRDGVSDFVKSKKIIHYSENPSIYVDPEGKLTMLASYRAKGMWQTGSLDQGWHCVNADFPPGGDCTFFFRWGEFDYIVGGFVDLWSKPAGAPVSEYKNMAADGNDFYNGFNVPAVSEIPGGRFVMAGWMPVNSWWGGPLLMHEMVQMPDGQLGTKWMDELVPETGTVKKIAQKLVSPMFYDTGKDNSFMIAFDVVPTGGKEGKFAVSFLPSEGAERGCEFQLRPADAVAQYADASFGGYAAPEKSLREGARPQNGRNYAIEKLIGTDKPFRVRIVVKYTDKLGGAIIDSEIAGKRTMLDFRPGLQVKKLMLKADGVEIGNVEIAPLK